MTIATLVSIATQNSSVNGNELTLFLSEKTLTKNGIKKGELYNQGTIIKLITGAMDLYKDYPTPITDVMIEFI